MSTQLSCSIHRAAKDYWCEQCDSRIERGTRYFKAIEVGVHGERGLVTFREHVDCNDAANHFYRKWGVDGEDCLILQDAAPDLDPDELEWLKTQHPDVAVRLGLTLPPSERDD